MSDNHYDSKTHTFGERRKPMDNLEKQLSDIAADLKVVNHKVDSIKSDVEQRLIDSRTMTEIQYAHIDSLMETHRQDNLKAHSDLIDAFKEHTQHLIERYEDRESVQNQKMGCFDRDIKDLQERVGDLEGAPAEKALDTKQKIAEWIKNGLVVAGIGAVFAIIAAFSRWDDFIKWVGHK